VYFRRFDRGRAMERVRDLSWASRFGSKPSKAPTGFEPVFGENADADGQGRERELGKRLRTEPAPGARP
jgi:hypothetical protein